MEVTRVKNITPELFIEKCIKANQPIIVTDGMEHWDREKFTPQYLKATFGDQIVQVYNDLFDLQTIQTLSEYIDTNFDRAPEDGPAKNYMRWYTKLKEVEFYWSDKVFEALKPAWSQPYFIPDTNLVIPSNHKAAKRPINEYSYPYKGLFISGRGSRTRLHKDPFMSNAVLCQFYGQKEIYLYSPQKQASVMNGTDFVDVKNPDHAKFRNFKNTTPDYKDVLAPGEIIFFPSGWFHDVTCLSDSVSITWNFVHETQLERMTKHIAAHPEDDQLEIMQFFMDGEVSESTDLVQYFQQKYSVGV